MASTFNAFDFLVGTGEQVSTSGKKKNKKNKSKAQENVPKAGPESDANTAGKPVASAQSLVVSAAEMVAILDKTARASTSSSERVRLWKEWCRQASEAKSDKAVLYKDSNGTYVDFNELFLRSQALEISAETCLEYPLAQQHQQYILQLFSTFLPADGAKTANVLAGAITRLGELLAHSAPDLMGAAQRAVVTVVRQLKTSRTDLPSEADAGQVSQWLRRLEQLDKDISAEQTLMHKLAQASANAVTRERIQSARKILKLQERQVEMLQPGNIPNTSSSSSASSAPVTALKELQSIVNQHLKDAEGLENSARGHAATASAQKKQTLAGYDREDAILAKQGQDVAAQIRTLEAQLQGLRMQATEIEQKRSRLRLLQKDTASAASNGPAHKNEQLAVLTTAQYQQQLAAVDSLLDIMDPHRHSAATMEQIWAAQARQPNAAADYVSLAHHYLSMNLAFLTEMPQKVNFSKQRIAQAEKLMKLTATNAKSLETNKKQKEDAEKLLADTMKSAEDALVHSEEVLKNVLDRQHSIAQHDVGLASSIAPQVGAVEELFARIGSQYTNVMTSYDQAPAPLVAPSHTHKGPGRKNHAHQAPQAPQVQQPAPKAAEPLAPVAQLQPVAPAQPVAAPMPQPTYTNGNGVSASPPRHQWGKIQSTEIADDGDSSLPTPAEAFRSSAEHTDGFKPVGSSRRNKKA